MKNITGIMIYYCIVCKRKLWYFTHNINMESENEDVCIGKYIDENTFMREEKHINIDNIVNIDFVAKEHFIHEVKKSKKIEEASIMQVKYYLYYLKNRGVNSLGAKIDYPLIKQCHEVVLTPEDEVMLEQLCYEIENISKSPIPPNIPKKRICKKCAYYELCFI